MHLRGKSRHNCNNTKVEKLLKSECSAALMVLCSCLNLWYLWRTFACSWMHLILCWEDNSSTFGGRLGRSGWNLDPTYICIYALYLSPRLLYMWCQLLLDCGSLKWSAKRCQFKRPLLTNGLTWCICSKKPPSLSPATNQGTITTDDDISERRSNRGAMISHPSFQALFWLGGCLKSPIKAHSRQRLESHFLPWMNQLQ